MPGPDDQGADRPAAGAAPGDLAAMVRVLEQRCREAEGQARLADEERRRLEQAIHQQQVQTDIAAQHRREAEAAYGQVRGALARVAAELEQTGGPGAEVVAAELLAIVGGDAETATRWPPPPVPPEVASDLASQLVRLVCTAGMVRTARRREWVVRGLCVVASVVVVSLVFGRLGASSVEVAGVQVAAPAPLVAPPMMPTPGTSDADAAWPSLAPQLDSTWERDWPGTIALLDGFRAQWPTYALAQDKLYAALVADAEANIQVEQVSAGVAELERAARLLPERGEAWARLAQLATAVASEHPRPSGLADGRGQAGLTYSAGGALDQREVEDALYAAAERNGLVAGDGRRQCWATAWAHPSWSSRRVKGRPTRLRERETLAHARSTNERDRTIGVTMDDPYNLERFVAAQEAGGTYASALAELRRGRKTSHWMWFVFPQIAGLGASHMSRTYAISSLEEAKAYLRHPVLGPRLIECAAIVANSPAVTAEQIFGSIDTRKLHSCITLFVRAAPGEPQFRRVLDRYFHGLPDSATDRLV